MPSYLIDIDAAGNVDAQKCDTPLATAADPECAGEPGTRSYKAVIVASLQNDPDAQIDTSKSFTYNVFDICTQDVITLDTEVPDSLPLYQLTTPAGILEVKSIYSQLYPKCPVTCQLTDPSR